MKKLLLATLLAGLFCSNLNAEEKILKDLQIFDEYKFSEYGECIVIGESKNKMYAYSLTGTKGSKDCEVLKNVNLKKGKTYKMKVDLRFCDEGNCTATFISLLK